ncbi:subtilisin-like protease [Hirsutella rhossiliensis]|uniref:Subtilisin-like protease n=1 Tax=Hirsutella rhossiliensis TaxID=111463 RepID=A0A9P8MWA8_9HYPO|nr:subtilisin-like protease [Hirsutella rhossiliensis]KAH0962212.1 subtilisin-like protease [Hirsutella rhossiliensis]
MAEQNVAEQNIHARAADQQDCTGSLKAYYKLTESFDKYLKTLDISASATVSGWGQSASVSGSYLDQAELSKDGLTYVAIIDVQRQSDSNSGFEFNKKNYNGATFAQDYGDRWIRGFHTGGKMIARLSFDSKGSVSKDELKVHAEASLKFWGVSGDLSASVKKSMEDFINNACRHNYEYRPLLDEYRNADNFPKGQKILDYRIAHLVSYKVLRELVRISEMSQYLQRLELHEDELKDDIEFASLEMVEASKNWVDSNAEKPESAIQTGRDLIKKFRTDFYDKYENLMRHDVYISGVEVIYGDQPPATRVLEILHHIEDINHNMGGEFVWLVPIYTARRDEACTSFKVIIQDGGLAGFKDLSKGAGGKNRYLQCEKTPSEDKIRRLALVRGLENAQDYLDELDHGFRGKTENINEGRGDSNDILHLLWAFDGKRDEASKKDVRDFYNVPVVN